MHDTPRYIKRNALISAILLLPFVFALLSNALHEAISGQPLYHSWLWQKPILGIWVLYLPLVAACIGLATWLLFLVERIQSKRQTWLSVLLDIRYTWPLILVSGAGLFILAVVFGHDSVHCIIGSPVREVQQWHQTWRCIQQG